MDIHISNLRIFFHPYLSLSHCPTGKLNPQLALETQESCVLRRDDFGMPRRERKVSQSRSKPTGSVPCWASKTNFLFPVLTPIYCVSWMGHRTILCLQR